jgi:hypothetical protein
MPLKNPRFLCRSRPRVPQLLKAALKVVVAHERTVDGPEDLTHKTTAQTGFYTHRGLDEQASSIRPGVLTPDTPPRSRPESVDRPRVRQRKMRRFFVSDLTRLTLRLYQGCDAYLRYFRERSVRERRDLTRRLGALFVSAEGLGRS